MIYSVIIDSMCPDIEEEVSVVVAGHRLTCFASYLPFPLEVGGAYKAELLPMVFDEYIVREVSFTQEPSITRQGIDYSYHVVGELADGWLRCGELEFFDEVLLADFGFLSNKMVMWKIDRLDIAFF